MRFEYQCRLPRPHGERRGVHSQKIWLPTILPKSQIVGLGLRIGTGLRWPVALVSGSPLMYPVDTLVVRGQILH